MVNLKTIVKNLLKCILNGKKIKFLYFITKKRKLKKKHIRFYN